MTIEEILQLVDHYEKHDDNYRREWAAAGKLLRAGQEMRKSCYSNEPGAIAWDAATKVNFKAGARTDFSKVYDKLMKGEE